MQHGPPPLWREQWAIAERAMLPYHPAFWGLGVPQGRGDPVLLIPGFTAGDESMLLLAGWLRCHGYQPVLAELGINVGCSGDLLELLERRLEWATAAAGRRALIIGQSRGGLFARALGVRHPTLTRAIITLGSPLLDPHAVHPIVAAAVRSFGRAGDRGVPGVLRSHCGPAGGCRHCGSLVSGSVPRGVGFVSIYSRVDGVVDWRACLDPDAKLMEVYATHCGMTAEGQCFAAIGRALASFTSD